MYSLKIRGLESKKGHSIAWKCWEILSGVMLNYLWHDTFRSSILGRRRHWLSWRHEYGLAREWMQLLFRWVITPCSSHVQISSMCVSSCFGPCCVFKPLVLLVCPLIVLKHFHLCFLSILEHGRFSWVQLSHITLRKIPCSSLHLGWGRWQIKWENFK